MARSVEAQENLDGIRGTMPPRKQRKQPQQKQPQQKQPQQKQPQRKQPQRPRRRKRKNENLSPADPKSSYVGRLKTLFSLYMGIPPTRRTAEHTRQIEEDFPELAEWAIEAAEDEQFYQLVMNKYPNQASRATYRTAMAAALDYLRMGRDRVVNGVAEERPELEETYERWRTEGVQDRRAVNAATGDKRQGPRFKDYASLAGEREELKRRWDRSRRDQLGPDDKGNIQVYWQYFVMCLYTLQPPLRLEWGDLKLDYCRDVEDTVEAKIKELTARDSIPLAHDGKHPQNFLLVIGPELPAQWSDTWQPRYKIIINYDKVSQTPQFRNRQVIDVTPQLAAVLTESLMRFRPVDRAVPRKYALPNFNLQLEQRTRDWTNYDQPRGEQSLGAMMRKAMKLEASIHTFRRAYATAIYTDSSKTYNDFVRISLMMRHNLATALHSYRRATADATPLPEGGDVVMPPAQPDVPRKKGTWNRKEWWKAYSAENALQIAARRLQYLRERRPFIEQRSKLSELNSGNIVTARESTLERLQIRQNPDGEWVSYGIPRPVTRADPRRGQPQRPRQGRPRQPRGNAAAARNAAGRNAAGRRQDPQPSGSGVKRPPEGAAPGDQRRQRRSRS